MQPWKASSKSRASAFEFFAWQQTCFLLFKEIVRNSQILELGFYREERVEEAPSGLIYLYFALSPDIGKRLEDLTNVCYF